MLHILAQREARSQALAGRVSDDDPPRSEGLLPRHGLAVHAARTRSVDGAPEKAGIQVTRFVLLHALFGTVFHAVFCCRLALVLAAHPALARGCHRSRRLSG